MSKGSSNAGAGGFTLFAGPIDEARARAARDTRKTRTGRPKRHLADIELRSLKQLETIQRRLGRKLAQNPDWIPDADFISSQSEVASTITKLSRSMRLAKEAEAKAMGGMTAEELDQVFVSQLPRLAPLLTAEDWHSLLAIGMGADFAASAVAEWKRRRDESKPPNGSKS